MRRDDAYLLDMLLAARDAVEFARGLTYAKFECSRLHQNAIVKSVEVIGEAVSRLSLEIKGCALGNCVARDRRHEQPSRSRLF